MKGNLWTFGDSLTEGYPNNVDWSKKYINWKGYKPKVYGEIIAERLDLELKNYGVGGSDNYTIFQKFCDVSKNIKKNDFIIFGWSSPVRFRLINSKKNWVTLIPNLNNEYHFIESISVSTIKEILVNRDCDLSCEEVNSWIKLINSYLKDNTVIHWTFFDPKLNAYYLNGYENIREETNGLLDDAHFSENGQIELSKTLLRLDPKNKTLI